MVKYKQVKLISMCVFHIYAQTFRRNNGSNPTHGVALIARTERSQLWENSYRPSIAGYI